MSSIVENFLISRNTIKSQYTIINKMRILIVEDEEKQVIYLKKNLLILIPVRIKLGDSDGGFLVRRR